MDYIKIVSDLKKISPETFISPKEINDIMFLEHGDIFIYILIKEKSPLHTFIKGKNDKVFSRKAECLKSKYFLFGLGIILKAYPNLAFEVYDMDNNKIFLMDYSIEYDYWSKSTGEQFFAFVKLEK